MFCGGVFTLGRGGVKDNLKEKRTFKSNHDPPPALQNESDETFQSARTHGRAAVHCQLERACCCGGQRDRARRLQQLLCFRLNHVQLKMAQIRKGDDKMIDR